MLLNSVNFFMKAIVNPYTGLSKSSETHYRMKSEENQFFFHLLTHSKDLNLRHKKRLWVIVFENILLFLLCSAREKIMREHERNMEALNNQLSRSKLKQQLRYWGKVTDKGDLTSVLI